MSEHDLRCCAVPFYSCTVNKYTYANEALGHYSIIDYMFCSDIDTGNVSVKLLTPSPSR